MANINATEIAIQLGIAEKHLTNAMSKLDKLVHPELYDEVKTALVCLDALVKTLVEKEFKEW